MALEEGMISIEEGDVIWQAMLKRRRLLPASTFSFYLQQRKIHREKP